MPRDPDRIPKVLKMLKQVWQKHPELRLGQLLISTTHTVDLFHVEDTKLLELLKNVLETGKFAQNPY